MSDLKTYLASKYMSGPKADAILARAGGDAPKKRRKKVKNNEDYVGGESSGSRLKLQDEDEWGGGRGEDVDLEGADAPVVGKGLSTFKKGKSAWSTVGATSIPVASSSRTGGDRADDDDNGVKAEPTDPASPPKQLTKRRGGLRTAAQIAAEAAQEAAEARSPSPEPEYDVTATVHRDQSGRVLDVNELRDAARREEEDERRKEAERKEWGKGLLQREEREKRAREERKMGERDVARRADDVEMNQEMREQERWNDPAAKFLTKKSKKGPRYPTYKGPFAPNRFGIAPGFRWDGVDRSTGFEKKYFQAQNAAARRTLEANAYSMEDM
ncbi:Pre-mRNA-splicing factor CWC26 [Vanrija pseudolonga]|uniref:Pre-mRNA-splicing factor CWC26 n=1 Tax=Vanrija pseudolonga TaxID=143232 RepID=A0AAF0YI79_9TREE|nr:Pre-mRNA-splicing factor CWC26 [Vanrija pseudolonga]